MKLEVKAFALTLSVLVFAPVHVNAVETRDLVEQALKPAADWAYPSESIPAADDKTIVFIADNLRNSGILSVAEGVREAADELDWQLQTIDARGDLDARRTGLAGLLSSPPDGLILGGFNASDHTAVLEKLAAGGTTILGWHAAAKPGPIAGTPVISNITTDPMAVAQVAAAYAIEATDHQAGVVIFTDTRFGIAVAKSDEMAKVLESCGTCEVLETVDMPLDQTSARMPAEIARLLDEYGTQWSVTLGINDLYFDDAIIELSFSEPAFAESLINISAGDGSVSAYQRIGSGLFQSATVPEPLVFQGWQIADELNRAFAGRPPSAFVAPTKLVTLENIRDDGGLDWRFEPANGYRDLFRGIWKP